MSTSRRLVSCIVAVFNGERYIGEAIDSILAQTHAPLEVLVVDDGSTDGTSAVVASYGAAIELIRQPNRGPAAARNTAVGRATGEFVAFLDADDMWHPDKLAKQLARFAANPDLDMSVTLVQNFWVPELREEEERFRGHRLSEPTPGYSTVALLARRRVFDVVGGFDESWQHVHDTEWFMRAADAGMAVDLLSEPLVRRRLHETNRSRLLAGASRDEYLSLIKRRVERSRGSAVPG